MGNIPARRLVATLFALAISGGALWWLLHGGAGQALLAALDHASLWPMVLAALLASMLQLLRAWRFGILASGALAWPSWTMVGIATRLILLNFLLPFKLGELGFPLMMKRAYGMPLAQGAGILILSRFLDLGVVAAILLATAALILDPAATGWSRWLLAAGALMALVLPLLTVDLLPSLRKTTRAWPTIDRLAEKTTFGAVMMRPWAQRLLVSALTWSIWLSHALIAYLAASAIGAGLTFLPLAMASAASNLAFALPISGVAGLGPPQAAWATMLHLTGVDWVPAITTALVCHGVLLTTILVLGMLTYLAIALQPPTAIKGPAGQQGSPSS